MEQNPHLFYDRQETDGELPPGRQRSPERLLPEAPQSKQEAAPGKSFEELVHEALEEELKYERDPQLRHQASQRADEILAEFQEVKNRQKAGVPSPTDQNDDGGDELTHELARQLGVKKEEQDRPVYPGSDMNFGLLDLVMVIVIALLLIIVILLLVF